MIEIEPNDPPENSLSENRHSNTHDLYFLWIYGLLYLSMLNSIHWVVKLNTLKDGEKHKDVENFKIMENRCYSIRL